MDAAAIKKGRFSKEVQNATTAYLDYNGTQIWTTVNQFLGDSGSASPWLYLKDASSGAVNLIQLMLPSGGITALRSIEFPDASGVLALAGGGVDLGDDNLWTGTNTFNGQVTVDNNDGATPLEILVDPDVDGGQALKFTGRGDDAGKGPAFLSVGSAASLDNGDNWFLPLGGGFLVTTAHFVDANYITAADTGPVALTLPDVAFNGSLAYTLMVKTADALAGTVSVTIAWEDEAGTVSQASTALSMAVVGRRSGLIPIRRKSGTDITYAVTHTGSYGSAIIDLRLGLATIPTI